MGGFVPAFHPQVPDVQVPSPFDIAQKRLTLQQMSQATQMNDQRIKEEQLKAQKAAQLQSDSEKLRTGMALPEIKGDIKKLIPWASQQGLQPETIQALQKHDADLDDKLSQRSERDLKTLQGHFGIIGDHLSAILGAPPEQRQTLGLAAIKDLETKGVVKPGEIDPSILNDEATLRYYADANAGAKSAADRETAKRAAAKGNLELDETKQQKMFGELAAAAGISTGEYLKAAGAVDDPKLRAMLPTLPEGAQPDQPLPSEFIESLQNFGMKPHEQATTALTKEQRRIAAEQAEGLAKYREQMADVAQDRAEVYGHLADVRQQLADLKEKAGAGGQTPNDIARDKRQARNEYNKLLLTEQKTAALRAALGPLVKKQQAGETVKDKNDQERDPKAEMDAATDSLAEIITAKHDAAKRAGLDIPGGDVNAALNKIGRGKPPDSIPNPYGRLLQGQQGGGGRGTPTSAGQLPTGPATVMSGAPATTASPAPARPAPTAAAPTTPPVGKRFSNGSMTVKWDGKNYIDEATGKPAVFK